MRFSIRGVSFELSFLAVAAMSATLVLDTSGRICACFIAAIIHECGHLLAMRCFCIKPQSIKLRIFDIAIEAHGQRPFSKDLIITIAGPLANFVFAFVFYFFSDMLFVSNLVIGLFNLLPVDTFDGGHALSLLLCKKLSAESSRRILKALTFLLLVPTFILGILVLLRSKYNYSLLLISLYLLVVLFLK